MISSVVLYYSVNVMGQVLIAGVTGLESCNKRKGRLTYSVRSVQHYLTSGYGRCASL